MEDCSLLEDRWLELVVKQGGRCRNCNNKAILYLISFDKETGIQTSESEETEMYKLCKDCAIDIDNAMDIKTYGWSYNQLKARDNKLDSDWHKKVYGSY